MVQEVTGTETYTPEGIKDWEDWEAVGSGKQKKPEKWDQQGESAGSGSPSSTPASSSGAGGRGELSLRSPSSSLDSSLLRGPHPQPLPSSAHPDTCIRASVAHQSSSSEDSSLPDPGRALALENDSHCPRHSLPPKSGGLTSGTAFLKVNTAASRLGSVAPWLTLDFFPPETSISKLLSGEALGFHPDVSL